MKAPEAVAPHSDIHTSHLMELGIMIMYVK
jgi:hypothetical protein